MTLPKKKICFTAESFGFGPISTTLNLLKYLKENTDISKRYSLTIVGDHTSKQLAETSPYVDEIIECDTSTTDGFKKIERHLKDVHLFVCNTNPGPVSFLKEKGIPVVYIDLLFWMWDDLEGDLRNVDSYIVENFVDLDAQKKRISLKNLPFKMVNPLIEEKSAPHVEDPSRLFMSFGGIDNVFAKTPPLLDNLLTRILPIVTEKFQKVVIAGGGETIEKLKVKFKEYPVEFGFFGRKEYQEQLSLASKCIINAGLITFYECYGMKKDLFFLPSFCYSQYQQFQYIRKLFPDIPGWDYSCSKTFEKIPMYLPEIKGLQKISNHVDTLVGDDIALDAWKDKIVNFINAPKREWWKNGEEPLRSGIPEIAEEIKKFL